MAKKEFYEGFFEDSEKGSQKIWQAVNIIGAVLAAPFILFIVFWIFIPGWLVEQIAKRWRF